MARRLKFRLPKIRLTMSRPAQSLLRSMSKLGRLARPQHMSAAGSLGRTVEITDFGSNPGQLKMFIFTPEKPVRANAALIVVLHGCGQYAGSFALDTGWIALSNHFKIPLVLPEQVRRNNTGRCFNWFRPADTLRGSGEALSVRQMVRTSIKRFSSDPRQVFVVGLSAGGALTAALLASYPAVFNAGAVVAGMPVGSASNAASALLRMHKANPFSTQETLIQAVASQQKISRRRRKWPRISIWHGSKDHTIDPANGAALALQWSGLHGFGDVPSSDEISTSGIRRRSWGLETRPSVEWWTIPEMGHGFPIDTAVSGGGRTAFGVIDAGISGAFHIAAFWGLTA